MYAAARLAATERELLVNLGALDWIVLRSVTLSKIILLADSQQDALELVAILPVTM